jgi:hypothetical protein
VERFEVQQGDSAAAVDFEPAERIIAATGSDIRSAVEVRSRVPGSGAWSAGGKQPRKQSV